MINVNLSQNLKKYKVSIGGESYSLISDESENHINQAVNLVESLLKDSATKNSDVDFKHLAVLGALQLASLLVKIEHNNGQLINFIDSELTRISEK